MIVLCRAGRFGAQIDVFFDSLTAENQRIMASLVVDKPSVRPERRVFALWVLILDNTDLRTVTQPRVRSL